MLLDSLRIPANNKLDASYVWCRYMYTLVLSAGTLGTASPRSIGGTYEWLEPPMSGFEMSVIEIGKEESVNHNTKLFVLYSICYLLTSTMSSNLDLALDDAIKDRRSTHRSSNNRNDQQRQRPSSTRNSNTNYGGGQRNNGGGIRKRTSSNDNQINSRLGGRQQNAGGPQRLVRWRQKWILLHPIPRIDTLTYT